LVYTEYLKTSTIVEAGNRTDNTLSSIPSERWVELTNELLASPDHKMEHIIEKYVPKSTETTEYQ
jgi:hypothetical protein